MLRRRPRLPKTHHFLPFLIPQIEPQRFQARPYAQRRNGANFRHFVVAALQVVVGDARAQVMDVVQADIPRKPLQHFGQFVVRTPLQRRFEAIPRCIPRPVDVAKLVLDIE